MAPPPTKRQKRLVVLSSDEEEDGALDSRMEQKQKVSTATTKSASNGAPKRSLPTRSRTKASSTTKQIQATESPKRPSRSRDVPVKKQMSRPISTFFNAANQTQQLNRKPPEATSPDAENEIEDLIEDISPDEEVKELRGTQNTTRVALDRRKRPREDKQPNGSQKFKLASNATKVIMEKSVTAEEVDSRPWAEKFGPNDLEELVVHKKKVSDVRNWLESVFQGRERKVCLSTI